jgi:hypothetical protein
MEIYLILEVKNLEEKSVRNKNEADKKIYEKELKKF